MPRKIILFAVAICSSQLLSAHDMRASPAAEQSARDQSASERSDSSGNSSVGKDGSVTMTFPRDISKPPKSDAAQERQAAENKALEKLDKANDRRDDVWSTKHTAEERGQSMKEAADAKNAAEKELSKP
jgi:hypothetical protein